MSYWALARGPYLRAWVAMLMTQIGLNAGWVALVWLAAHRSGAGAVGILTAAFGLPGVVSGVYAGVLLDRMPRAIGIAIDNGGRAILYALIAALASRPTFPLPAMTVLVALGSLLMPLSQAGIWSLIPDLLQPGQAIGAANAAMNGIWQIATLTGPAVGGLLTARFGPAVPLGLQSACFAGAAAVMLPLRHIRAAAAPAFALWAGLKVVLGRPAVLALTFFTAAYSLVYAPLEVVLPGFVSRDLHAGASGYGFLWTVFAIGALAGSALWGGRRHLPRLGWWLAGNFFVWGLVVLALSATHHLLAAVSVMAFGGFVYSPYLLWTNTYLQQAVPGNLLGRLFGAYTALTGLGLPLGALLAGAVAPTLPVRLLLGLAGLASVALGLLAASRPVIRGLPDLNLARGHTRPPRGTAPEHTE
jgi:MFS family permease